MLPAITTRLREGRPTVLIGTNYNDESVRCNVTWLRFSRERVFFMPGTVKMNEQGRERGG